MSEKYKAIVVGRRNSKIGKSVLRTFKEEQVRFVSPRRTLQDVLGEVTNDNASGEISIYFQKENKCYSYNLAVSQRPIDARAMLMAARGIKEHYRRM